MRAKALGSKYVMCAWIPHQDGVLTIDDAKKAVEVFNKAGKYLKENGLIFCYHAHGYEFQPYQDGTLLDYIVKNTNPDYVSFEMDIFWIQFGGGDPVARARAARTATAHATLATKVDEARHIMETLGNIGISLDGVTDTLLNDGLRLFSEAFDRLLAAVEANTRRA